MRLIGLTTLAMVLILGVSCVGTDVGNPEEEPLEEAEVELQFSGYEDVHPGGLMLAEQTRLVSAWIALEQFGFQRAGECSDEPSYDTSAAMTVDLLAADLSYEPPMITKKTGEYCRLNLRASPASKEMLPDSAPRELNRWPVVVVGERKDGVAFQINAELERGLGLAGAAQGFRLSEGPQRLIVGFDLQSWIDEESLAGIEGEEPIVIDKDNHSDVLDDFQKRVRRSARLFRDANENGRIDADERNAPMARGENPPVGDNRPEGSGRDGGGKDDAGR